MRALNNFAAAEKEDDQPGRRERSPSPTPEEQPEYELIEGFDPEDIRELVQCPICLEIIRNTRTVMECLHRFCQECIDKSMRLGNHECPTCRQHCASRRSLRPDPRFDALIAAMFGNIDSYEAQDLEFDEDELARKKQIQESIAQVSERQSEALLKIISSGEEDAEFLPRSQPRGSGSRRRGRRSRNMVQETLVANDDDNNRGIASSSAEILPRIPRKRRSATRSTCPNNNDNDFTEEADQRDSREIGHAYNPQGDSSQSVEEARLNKLIEYLRSVEFNSV